MEPWPLDSTKRSRSAHCGLAGLCLRKSLQSTSAISAMPIGAPGCPLLAFCTESMPRPGMPLARPRRLGLNTPCDFGRVGGAYDSSTPPEHERSAVSPNLLQRAMKSRTDHGNRRELWTGGPNARRISKYFDIAVARPVAAD